MVYTIIDINTDIIDWFRTEAEKDIVYDQLRANGAQVGFGEGLTTDDIVRQIASSICEESPEVAAPECRESVFNNLGYEHDEVFTLSKANEIIHNYFG